MKLRLLLLLCLFQWSISCVSVQAATTPVVYYGKVLSGGCLLYTSDAADE